MAVSKSGTNPHGENMTTTADWLSRDSVEAVLLRGEFVLLQGVDSAGESTDPFISFIYLSIVPVCFGIDVNSKGQFVTPTGSAPTVSVSPFAIATIRCVLPGPRRARCGGQGPKSALQLQTLYNSTLHQRLSWLQSPPLAG